jgi:hypothetical protein
MLFLLARSFNGNEPIVWLSERADIRTTLLR